MISPASVGSASSSYPLTETSAAASKNCFQNYTSRSAYLCAWTRGLGGRTLAPSHTLRDCSAYRSTTGRQAVAMRWQRMKLWSISCRHSVIACSSRSSRSKSVVDILVYALGYIGVGQPWTRWISFVLTSDSLASFQRSRNICNSLA